MDSEQSDRASYWYGHLDQAAELGLSFRQYAEQAGVKLHRLYFWSSRRKALVQARGEAGLFARVEVAQPAHCRVPGVQRLHLPNGAVLEWDGGADLALIDHLLDR